MALKAAAVAACLALSPAAGEQRVADATQLLQASVSMHEAAWPWAFPTAAPKAQMKTETAAKPAAQPASKMQMQTTSAGALGKSISDRARQTVRKVLNGGKASVARAALESLTSVAEELEKLATYRGMQQELGNFFKANELEILRQSISKIEKDEKTFSSYRKTIESAKAFPAMLRAAITSAENAGLPKEEIKQYKNELSATEYSPIKTQRDQKFASYRKHVNEAKLLKKSEQMKHAIEEAQEGGLPGKEIEAFTQDWLETMFNELHTATLYVKVETERLSPVWNEIRDAQKSKDIKKLKAATQKMKENGLVGQELEDLQNNLKARENNDKLKKYIHEIKEKQDLNRWADELPEAINKAEKAGVSADVIAEARKDLAKRVKKYGKTLTPGFPAEAGHKSHKKKSHKKKSSEKSSE